MVNINNSIKNKKMENNLMQSYIKMNTPKSQFFTSTQLRSLLSELNHLELQSVLMQIDEQLEEVTFSNVKTILDKNVLMKYYDSIISNNETIYFQFEITLNGGSLCIKSIRKANKVKYHNYKIDLEKSLIKTYRQEMISEVSSLSLIERIKYLINPKSIYKYV